MENNEEKILNEIKTVLNERNDKKSFSLQGTWGIGKTYFFQHKIKPMLEENGYAVIEISLFGMNDINTLNGEIVSKIIESIYSKKITLNIYKKFFNDILFKKLLKAAFWKNAFIKILTFMPKFYYKHNNNLLKEIKEINNNYGVNLINVSIKDLCKRIDDKLFFCFDDCERAVNANFFNEFLSLIMDFNDFENLASLAIGNMPKLPDEIKFDLYKEKVFSRNFSLKKEDMDIIDILLNKYDKNSIFYEKSKNMITNIITKKDNFLNQMNSNERNIYDESIDLYTNMRVLSEILYIINRVFECLSRKGYTISDYGIDNIIASFFFFGILFNSSEKIKDFDVYSDNDIISTLYDKENREYLYSEILSLHISDFFKKLKSAFDYFNEGYFDEDTFLGEISVYQQSDLSRFLEQELEDINGKAFYLSFIADNDRLRNLREKLSKEISENSKEISFEMINSIIAIFVISDIFLNDFHVDDDKTNIIKYLSKDTINSLEDSVSYYYSIKDCVYINIFKERYKSYVDFFINALKEDDEKMYIETKKSIFSGNDSKKVISFIVEEISRNGNLNKDDLNDVTKFIMRKIEENNIFSDFSDFIELCKKVPSERKLIEMLDAFQENTPQGIRKEFFEWLIYIISNR